MSLAQPETLASPQPAAVVERTAHRSALTALLKQLDVTQSSPHMPAVAAPSQPVRVTSSRPSTQLPAAGTPLRKKAAKLTYTDMFAGGGGSSLGALRAGLSPTYSFNHWPAAVAAEAVNCAHSPTAEHPGAGAYVASLELSAISGFGSLFAGTDIVWASPSCPPWSSARRGAVTGTARTVNRTAAQMKDELERARAGMWAPVEWVQEHPGVRAVVIENVVDLLTHGGAGWVMLPAWLAAWDALGFAAPQVVCFNSMFAGRPGDRVPQSRDRAYLVFHRKGERAPDLRFEIEAWCDDCGREVAAVQAGSRPHPLFPGAVIGKYGRGWRYVCPRCQGKVTPQTNGVLDALDLEDLGAPVTSRSLGATTLARIQAGIDKLDLDAPTGSVQALQPLLIALSYASDPTSKPGRATCLPSPTLTARQELGVAFHEAFLPGARRPRRMPSAMEMSFRMLKAGTGLDGPADNEVGRIGGFPDSYVWPGASKRDRWRMVGNAVTPQVAQMLLERVVAAL